MDIVDVLSKRRYFIVTENNEFWVDDYFIGPGGATAFIKNGQTYVMLNIYEPILYTIDYASEYTPGQIREEIKKGMLKIQKNINGVNDSCYG